VRQWVSDVLGSAGVGARVLAGLVPLIGLLAPKVTHLAALG
jgi:hypothetical protein